MSSIETPNKSTGSTTHTRNKSKSKVVAAIADDWNEDREEGAREEEEEEQPATAMEGQGSTGEDKEVEEAANEDANADGDRGVGESKGAEASPASAVRLALQQGVPPPAVSVAAVPGTKTASVTSTLGGGGGAGKKGKKESFKWNTPADEFAEDVGSDEEGEFLTTVEDFEDNGNQDIVIHLGEGADRFEIERKLVQIKGENKEDIQRFLASYNLGDSSADSSYVASAGKRKKPESKQKYECPKCNKIWNWPWELRRHVLTHYKEVINVAYIASHYVAIL